MAATLRDRDYRVLGTTRDPGTIAEPLPGVEYLPLDLTDDASIEACVAAAGPVDVLINNAGESQNGPLEELPGSAIERVFALNVFGAVRLTQLVLPGMRARGSGRVIMIGSMLASFPLAYRSSYVASKAALKGFASAARRELAPYGVRLSTVEPGSTGTGISARRTHYFAEESPYATEYRTMLEKLNANEARGIAASTVAVKVLEAIEAREPAPLYAVGSRAPLVFALRRLLPRTVIERIVARAHGLR